MHSLLGKGREGCCKNLNFLLVVKKWDALKDSVQDENMLNFNSRNRLLPTVTTPNICTPHIEKEHSEIASNWKKHMYFATLLKNTEKSFGPMLSEKCFS